MEKTKSKKFYLTDKVKILAYILLVPIIYGVSSVRVYNIDFYPFGIGLVFSLLYAGVNGYCLSAIYLTTNLIVRFSINGFFEILNVCVVLDLPVKNVKKDVRMKSLVRIHTLLRK